MKSGLLSQRGPVVGCKACRDTGLIEVAGNPFEGDAFPATGVNLLAVFVACVCERGDLPKRELRALLEEDRHADFRIRSITEHPQTKDPAGESRP